MAFCRKCGKEIDDDAVICVHCGCATEKAARPSTNQTLTMTLIQVQTLWKYFSVC